MAMAFPVGSGEPTDGGASFGQIVDLIFSSAGRVRCISANSSANRAGADAQLVPLDESAGLETIRAANIGDREEFFFEGVPEGRYTVYAGNAAQAEITVQPGETIDVNVTFP